MIARIEPAGPPFPPAVQEIFDSLLPDGMEPLRLFTTLARDQRLFRKFMNSSLLDRGNLTLRQREIVIDRVTARCGSEYEFGVHIALFADKAGLTTAQIYSLAHGDATDACWAEATDRLLIRLCDALHDECAVGDDLWNRLSGVFDDRSLLEVLLLCGFYRTVSYLTNTLELPREPFASGFPGKA